MSETEVKACPLCENASYISQEFERCFTPCCSGCGLEGRTFTVREEAVVYWNTRTTDAENQRLREALENHINELAEQMGKIVIAYNDRGKVDFATKDQRFIVLNGLYTSLMNAIAALKGGEA